MEMEFYVLKVGNRFINFKYSSSASLRKTPNNESFFWDLKSAESHKDTLEASNRYKQPIRIVKGTLSIKS